MIISIKCIDVLLCTFKTGHLLLIMIVYTEYINQLRKKDSLFLSRTTYCRVQHIYMSVLQIKKIPISIVLVKFEASQYWPNLGFWNQYPLC